MATFKASVFDAAKVSAPPTEPDDVVRLVDLEGAVQNLATAEQLETAIDEVTHNAVTVDAAGKTVTLSVSAEQVLGAEVKPVADSVIQASASGVEYTQAVVALATESTLGKTNVSNVVVVRRNIVTQVVTATGVEGVDYVLNDIDGIVTYKADSNLLNDDESPIITEIFITFDCALIQDGSGLLVTNGGLTNNFGTEHHQVPRGDHRHANDHQAASGDSTAASTTTTVDGDQKVKTELKLSAQGGVKVFEDGVGADMDVLAAKEHDHAIATNTTPGFMSTTMVNALNAAAQITPVTVADTATVTLAKALGEITATVKTSTGITADANGIKADMDVLAAKSVTDDHETRIGGLEDSDTAQNTAINLKAATTYVDAADDALATAIASKASVAYVDDGDEALADAIALKADQTQVDELEESLDGKYSATNKPPIVTDEEQGEVTPEMKEQLECLSVLLRERQYAQQFMPMMRVESPNTGAPGLVAVACPLKISAKGIKVGGVTTKAFTLDIDINGVTELKDITGGTAILGTSGRAVTGGTPAVDSFNLWKIVVSDDGTGSPATHYLNVKTVSDVTNAPVLIAYTLRITIKGGATVSLETESADSLQGVHSVVVPGVPPYPSIFAGHFLQLDPKKIVGACSLGDLISGGSVNGIIITGGSTGRDGRDGLDGDGTNGGDGIGGWNGTNGTDGSGIPGGVGPASTNNEPALELARDLTRLTLMDGGASNGWIHDILVDGEIIWVGGSFTRFGNHNCWGLARLDKNGRYLHTFAKNGAGFSEAIRWLGRAASGEVFAASVNNGFYQNQHSARAHRIQATGLEYDTFVATPRISTDDADHPDKVIGLAALDDGKVALLTPRTLTVLNADGTVFSRNDAPNDKFLSVLAFGNKILLSSHAWSEAGVVQRYGTLSKPRGLKLLEQGDGTMDLDAAWNSPATAGTGANSSCGKAVLSPNSDYFIVGNALTRYNGINTSWNAELLGNLLAWSNISAEGSTWTIVGDVDVSAGDGAIEGIETQSVQVVDESAVEHGYIYQDAIVINAARYVSSVYIEKGTATPFPVFQVEFLGGTEPTQCYAYLNKSTGAFQLVDATGGLSPVVTVEDLATHWRISIAATNNETGNTSLRFTIFPAYSNVMGGSSTALTGGIDVFGAQVIKEAWEIDYVPTTSDPVLPENEETNSDRFRGLYKIGVNGKEDLTFACNITLSATDGLVTPFAIDAIGRIYLGGPIATIDDASDVAQTVTPWMLYRLTPEGKFDQQFNLFDDDVLAMRLSECGDLIVGGKFTSYGARRVGRLVILNPEGEPIQETFSDDQMVVGSLVAPDTTKSICNKKKLWHDLNFDPPLLKNWNNGLQAWVQIPLGTPPQLQPVIISPTPELPQTFPVTITLSHDVIGVSIWYTTDGTDPKSSSSTRVVYSGEFDLETAATVKCFAVKTGFTDSDTSSSTYGDKMETPVINPDGGNITYPQEVTITMPVDADAPDFIYYTVDGSNPAVSVTREEYSAPFEIDSDVTVIKAVAVKADSVNSDIAVATYGALTLPQVTFDPASGTSTPIATVTLSIAADAPYTIYYTVDGTDPTDTGNPSRLNYNTTGAFSMDDPGQVKAYATKVGWNDAPVNSILYGEKLPDVVFTPGDQSQVQDGIMITCPGHPDASIYYTLDGTNPRASDGNPSGSATMMNPVDGINLSESTLIRAFALESAWISSDVSDAYYYDEVSVWLANINFTRVGEPVKHGGMATTNEVLDDEWNEKFGARLNDVGNSETNAHNALTLDAIESADGTPITDAAGTALPVTLQFNDSNDSSPAADSSVRSPILFEGTSAAIVGAGGIDHSDYYLYYCSTDEVFVYGGSSGMLPLDGTTHPRPERVFQTISVGDNAYRTSMRIKTVRIKNGSNPASPDYVLKIDFKGIERGFYELYVYAHSTQNAEYGSFVLGVDGEESDPKTTSSGLPSQWRNTNWVENKQYVKFSFEVFGTGYTNNTFFLKVKPTSVVINDLVTTIADSVVKILTATGFINAIQLRKTNTPPRLNPPIIEPEDEHNLPLTARMEKDPTDPVATKIRYTIGASDAIAEPTEASTLYTEGEDGFELLSADYPVEDFPDGVYIKAKSFLAGYTTSNVTLKHFRLEGDEGE